MSWAAIMTCYKRPDAVLRATVHGLQRCFPECQPIIVYDGDEPRGLEGCTELQSDTLGYRTETYNIAGYNNPAHAFNVGLAEAARIEARNLLILSSDVIITPSVAIIARGWIAKDMFDTCVLTPTVIDMDSCLPYCSPQAIWPLPWAMMCRTDDAVACGGWDEGFLRGIAFEDNDFAARLAIKVGHLCISGQCAVYHQSHEQTAYSDNGEGWNRNEAYCISKWGGVPFRPGDTSLDVEQIEEGTGGIVLRVRKAEK